MNWRSIAFLLESAVFLLIGLQARSIIDDAMGGDDDSAGRIVAVCGSTLVGGDRAAAGLGVLRALPAGAARARRERSAAAVDLHVPARLGRHAWRGHARGGVRDPEDTPHRDVLLLIAFTVTAGTLFIQGLSLPWVARRLKVPSPDPAADALARANLLHQASQAGLAKLDELEEDDPHARQRARSATGCCVATTPRGSGSAPARTRRRATIYARRRKLMIDAEREPGAGDPRHRHGRARGGRRGAGDARRRGVDARLLRPRSASGCGPAQKPVSLEGDCEHLQKVRPPVEPDTPGECGDCLREGTTWVHLRMCVICGHIACCDSSPERHASAPPRRDRPRGDALRRGRRGLALVLRRPADRLTASYRIVQTNGRVAGLTSG